MRKRRRPTACPVAIPRASVKRRVVFYLAATALIFSSALATALSREEGDRLQRKIDDIAANASARPPKPKITPVSQTELNSYLAYNLPDKIPRGLAQPEITMVGNGALAGRVLVDMDEFKRGRDAQDFLDPLNYVSGQVPVTARGILRTESGKGRFQLASAELMGVPIPPQLVQELVGYFSRTAENPRGFDLNAPFDLPAKIRRIEIKREEALIAQ
ncbi:MAG TPA: hypothetical protein VKH64_14770 [Candidatus Binatia bacterium]|nr:hypothetical protein [Candidatus Binatia bacterium]